MRDGAKRVEAMKIGEWTMELARVYEKARERVFDCGGAVSWVGKKKYIILEVKRKKLIIIKIFGGATHVRGSATQSTKHFPFSFSERNCFSPQQLCKTRN